MEKTSPWGLTRSGRSPLPAAAAVGALLTAIIAVGTWAGTHDGRLTLVVATAVAAPACALGWLIVVDRASMSGAPRHPEQSIETSWYDRATRDAFHDMLIAIGAALLALTLVPQLRSASASLVLGLVCAFVTLDVALRYTVLKRRES